MNAKSSFWSRAVFLASLLCIPGFPMDLFAQSYRCVPDTTGRLRCEDANGNVSRLRPDGAGGFRARDNTGTTRGRPDGFGGYIIRHPDGKRSRVRPDGIGGYRIQNPDGTSTRCRARGGTKLRCQ